MGVAIKLKARHEFHYGDLHYKKFLEKENFPKKYWLNKNELTK